MYTEVLENGIHVNEDHIWLAFVSDVENNGIAKQVMDID